MSGGEMAGKVESAPMHDKIIAQIRGQMETIDDLEILVERIAGRDFDKTPPDAATDSPSLDSLANLLANGPEAIRENSIRIERLTGSLRELLF